MENTNYYNTWIKKLIDFLVGFIGFFLLFFVIGLIVKNTISDYLVILVSIAVISLPIITLFFYKINRKYIAIGAAWLIGLPIIAYGVLCIIAIGS